jgi:GAF domain-containing protein
VPSGGADDAVQAVSQFLVADVPLGVTLTRIAVLARDAIDPALAVGLTLLDERERPTTAVFTDEVSPSVDQGQYQCGAGPCLEAFRTGRTVRVDDSSAVDGRWPAFSRDAVANGVLSTLSLPLGAAGETFGAFNLYATRNHAFTESDEDDASRFATQASIVLANALAYWGAVDLSMRLREAIESRALIEQAKGKLMAQGARTADEAFAMLVSASQRENLKLRDIARHIVEGPPPA